jgi:hypothetical protein
LAADEPKPAADDPLANMVGVIIAHAELENWDHIDRIHASDEWRAAWDRPDLFVRGSRTGDAAGTP